MTTDGRMKVEHDPACTEPLNEHTGYEPCFRVVIEDEDEEEFRIAHYTRGVQGNTTSDTRADYLARYGPCPELMKLGTYPPVADRRDNRDPAEVGEAYLKRAIHEHGPSA